MSDIQALFLARGGRILKVRERVLNGSQYQRQWGSKLVARLAQILGNLLNNAGKFTNSGDRISLSVESDGEQAIVRVRDSGIGIGIEQLPQIFNMFMQVDTSLERSRSGLGIGLTW